MVGTSQSGGLSGRSGPVLVGGFGVPWQRDLDFGSRFVCCAEDLEWPEDVVVEDLSYSALDVLYRLQDLGPAQVVLVTAAPRGEDPPGTLRRYSIGVEPPPPEEVHRNLVEAVGGGIDLEQTLAVARHWGALPAGSVMIELEPADTSLGLGLSEEVAACIDSVFAAVREELGGGLLATASTVSDERIRAQLLGPEDGERTRGAQVDPSGTAPLRGPLDRRLALRSLATALRPGFEVTAAATTLVALADGNRTALLRAIARLRGGVEARSGPVGERAAASLSLALAMLDGRDTAEFLVGLQEQVLQTFTSRYPPRADGDQRLPESKV